LEPDWVVLYSDLNEVNSISVVEGLKKNGYQYKISEDKKSILVPSSARDDMRMFVAENDLIKTGDGGFELLDDMQLGSTDFKNKLTKQRIFQGEITRTLQKISGIKYAKVQLAEPERSIFEDNDEKPSASVMLVLDPGFKLKSTQVKAIKNLVAYSIPRLTPEQVFITDQDGNVLSDETSKNSTDMESFKANLEKQTAKKVTDVLEKITGSGNVSVQVNADIDFNSAKSTIESYLPVNENGNGVVTSSQTETETYENPNQVPGSTTVNQKNLNYSKQKSSVNYNISKEVKQVIYAPGSIKRLSIAVAVNKILTDEEKEELKQLVLSAAGVDYSRGDVISISGLQFEEAPISKKKLTEDFNKEYEKEQFIDLITTTVIPLAIVLIFGLFALFILKNLISKIPKPTYTASKPVVKGPEIRIPEEAAEYTEPVVTPTKTIDLNKIVTQKEQSINMLNDAIMTSPEEAAKLLTSFIKE